MHSIDGPSPQPAYSPDLAAGTIHWHSVPIPAPANELPNRAIVRVMHNETNHFFLLRRGHGPCTGLGRPGFYCSSRTGLEVGRAAASVSRR